MSNKKKKKMCWNTISICNHMQKKKITLGPFLTLHIKINMEWVTDLNAKCEKMGIPWWSSG